MASHFHDQVGTGGEQVVYGMPSSIELGMRRDTGHQGTQEFHAGQVPGLQLTGDGLAQRAKADERNAPAISGYLHHHFS